MAEDESKEESGSPSMLPLIMVLLIIPLATMVITQFVVIPQLQTVMGGGAHPDKDPDDSSHAKEKDSGGHGGSHGAEHEATLGGAKNSYAFDEIVSNLSGTMGTRFIKVSFEVHGEGADVAQTLRVNKSVVLDAIITTLSSQSIQSLEVPGGRNRLRLSLIEGINQSLNEDLIDQLYFTEFMIQ